MTDIAGRLDAKPDGTTTRPKLKEVCRNVSVGLAVPSFKRTMPPKTAAGIAKSRDRNMNTICTRCHVNT